jgi:lysophospholipase L1-like esterase
MIFRLLCFTIWLFSTCEVLNAADFTPAKGSFPAISSNTAIIPVCPDNKPNWIKRHEWINGEAKKGGVELIYVGDSIVQYFDSHGKDTWERYYAPRHALNLGISGDRTQHVLWRLDHGNIDGISPKLAIVMIGQNNGGHNTGWEIAEGVTAVVQRIRTKLPDTKILLLGIFQRRAKPVPERADLAQANGIISMLADNKTIFYMDINPVFLQQDGTIPAILMPDFEHPSPLGHRLWAEAIEAKTAQLMGDKPVAPMVETPVNP